MPPAIRAFILEEWVDLDADGPVMIEKLRKTTAISFFAHTRSTFKQHLTQTFGVLACWGQPADVRRAGLFHTAYSGNLFDFYVFNALDKGDRADLRDILGTEGEGLTYLFGTVNRSHT